jgi:hypothetical protein
MRRVPGVKRARSEGTQSAMEARTAASGSSASCRRSDSGESIMPAAKQHWRMSIFAGSSQMAGTVRIH